MRELSLIALIAPVCLLSAVGCNNQKLAQGAATPTPVGPHPQIDAEPNPLSLIATVNQTGTGTITITNVGDADLHVSGATLEASSSPALALPAAASWPQTLAPMASVQLPVTYHPTDTTAATGAVDIASDDPASPITTVQIDASGTNNPVPDINAVPNPLAFGDVQRLTCKTLTAQIQNVGSAALNVTGITRSFLTSSDWTFTPTVFTVQPGGAQPLSVTFCPSGTGFQLGELDIASNDPDENPYKLYTTGNGTPPPLNQTDIWVKLEWDTNDTDLDTHLWKGGATYKSSTGDCYYANCVSPSHLDWGVLGNSSDDPYLDTDDVDGYGPENLDISNAPTDTYTVAIFYYSDHGNGGPSAAKVTVYLNGTQVWQGTKSLYNHDLWTIMNVNWNHTTDSGTTTMIDTVAQASPLVPDDDPPKPSSTTLQHVRPF